MIYFSFFSKLVRYGVEEGRFHEFLETFLTKVKVTKTLARYDPCMVVQKQSKTVVSRKTSHHPSSLLVDIRM